MFVGANQNRNHWSVCSPILTKSSLILVILLSALFCTSSSAVAGCQGCCSYHGGVCCVQGVTACCDGVPLSDACVANDCNVCGTFQDVPVDHWAYDSIENLYTNGITKGCDDINFCPDEAVNRAQMAVFLGRAVHGDDFQPPAALGWFGDVPVDYWATDWIEQFYSDGVTNGCKSIPLLYCPEQPVTRAEMAVFLLRAKYGSDHVPPAAQGLFTDAESHWARDWIEELYLEGITTGCSDEPLAYCPEDTVTRAQMAVFITRTFDLGYPSTTLKIASWNIENFGKTKCEDPVRMAKIAQVIAGFDIVAVQELSNIKEQIDPGCPRNEGACPDDSNCGLIRNSLEKYLNEDQGLNYQFVISPQIKDERYMYVYNPQKVTLINSELVSDPLDSLPICDLDPSSTGLMVRQPFKATFRAGSFDFTLLTAHTSPSVNLTELDGLYQFYTQVETEGEPDVIILGDLNADCNYLHDDDLIALRNPVYTWVVTDDTDTTVSSTDCAYDRMIFNSSTEEDFAGNWGVVSGIPDNVSDHFPIWAEFYTNRDSD